MCRFRLILLLFGLGLMISTCPTGFEDDVETLIAELPRTTTGDLEYSRQFANSRFLPYEIDGGPELSEGNAAHSHSAVLRRIVSKGARSVPALVRHLSDERPVHLSGLGASWTAFWDEYDFNPRTYGPPPEGVNRKDIDGHPDSHILTVGDLCFVALGQIVSRKFEANRWQLTGGAIFNSPTYSRRLREVVQKDWTGFTRQQHRQLLIDDFERPNDQFRRVGAYQRLTFYFPDVVEALVLKELRQPAINGAKIRSFLRDSLYKTVDPMECRRRYEEFIRDSGPDYIAGVRDLLFEDLNSLEANEEGRSNESLEYGTQPRELLVQLFDQPKNVTRADRPAWLVTYTYERAWFIESLIHDQSRQIGDAVRQILLEESEDPFLPPACVRSLANRGYPEVLLAELAKLDFGVFEENWRHREMLQAICTSRDSSVRTRLLQILTTTVNETYFLWILESLPQEAESLALEHAQRLLNALPDKTELGRSLLRWIAEEHPGQISDALNAFLTRGAPERAETVCQALWGLPLSKRLLAPLLNDHRPLPGFSLVYKYPMRVCDLAAQTIHRNDEDRKELTFDYYWPIEQKDRVISRLKQYCEEPDL